MIDKGLDENTRKLLADAKTLAGEKEADFEHVLLVDLRLADSGVLWEFIKGEKTLRHSLERKLENKSDGDGYSVRLELLIEQLQGLQVHTEDLKDLVKAVDSTLINWRTLLCGIVAVSSELTPLLRTDLSLTWQSMLSCDEVASREGATTSSSSDLSINEFIVDLTDLAKLDLRKPPEHQRFGKLVGREKELGQLMAVLLRKQANNPVLIGEAGVGKTQIVEGLAASIASGEAPAKLQGKSIKAIDVSLLVAGTKFRGEFEERISKLVSYAKESKGQSIFFIDEIHNLMGLGSTSGSNDAANMLKPALSRGEFWCVGATTFAEFSKLEKDPAVRRRFQPVIVEEQSHAEIEEVVRAVVPSYERYHGVSFSSDTVSALIRMAQRYIGDVRSPAREIGLVDEVGAHFSLVSQVGDTPKEISRDDVAAILAKRTGIPVGVVSQEIQVRLANLKDSLSNRVYGQMEAIEIVEQQCRASYSGINDPGQPRGVFFFAGPSGVGKTELAKAIAAELYGHDDAMIRLDMSEFDSASAQTKLIGSDPGLVGYEEGGRLTEAVRRKPFSLILLDEFEKAHPSVWRLFLQVFDDGRLTDGKGRTASFNESTIVMTSNIGSAAFNLLNKLRDFHENYSGDGDALPKDFNTRFDIELRSMGGVSPVMAELLKDESLKILRGTEIDKGRIVEASLLAMPNFPAELLSRIGAPIAFPSLDTSSLCHVLEKTARNLVQRIVEQRTGTWETESLVSESGVVAIAKSSNSQRFALELCGNTVDYLVENGNDPLFGARALLNIFRSLIHPLVADRLLEDPRTDHISIHLDPKSQSIRLNDS